MPTEWGTTKEEMRTLAQSGLPHIIITAINFIYCGNTGGREGTCEGNEANQPLAENK